EAYAFGLLGSAFTRRVLAGAAVAAVGVTPVWLFAIMTPPVVFFMLQVIVALVVLGISYATFVSQSLETAWGPTVEPMRPADDRKDEFLQQFERFEQDDEYLDERSDPDIPVVVPVAAPAAVAEPAQRQA